MSLTWDGMMSGLSELKFAVEGQTAALSAGQLTIPSQGCRTLNTSGSIEGLAATNIASPAPASEDALAGTKGGGEHTKESSPLKKFAGEIDAQTGQVSASATSPAIHSGDTIERLCEERGRR